VSHRYCNKFPEKESLGLSALKLNYIAIYSSQCRP
jgi:hypothetical protein